MNYWKTIDCDNYDEINQEILNWVELQTHIKNSETFWNPISVKELMDSCPKFKQWTTDKNFYIKSIAVTYGTNVNCCGAHVDTPPARYKLSWPVKNTKGSWNRWFKESGPVDSFTNQLGGKAYKNYNNLEELAKNELLGPCLIDAGIPHDVWYEDQGNAKFPRIGLQCHLMKEPKSL